jgi:hypothetical protein
MQACLFRAMRVAAIIPVIATAQHNPQIAGDRHPDLSGTWAGAGGLATALKKVVDGKVVISKPDQSRPPRAVSALPSAPAPSYKPQFQAKVKELSDHESKVDPVFYCGKPGVPRVGAPRRIIQLPTEIVFLYEDMSGDPYRVIPTDGRGHSVNANPSAYGDSVGHWEGDTLVIETTSLSEDTWFGEDGYFHSDALRVTERLWREGENLVWQATVEDPKVLAAPWTIAPRVMRPSNEPLEESPRCLEDDGARLLNLDHHRQR